MVRDPVFPCAAGVRHVVRVRTSAGARYAEANNGRYETWTSAPWSGGEPDGGAIDPAGAILLAPCEPTKIVCVGVNYAEHARESPTIGRVPEEPILFLKPPSSLIGHGAAIRLPAGVGRVDHEAEIALVVGRRLTRADRSEARDGIAGVTALNDVSARVLQKRDVQFTRAKGFDSFCPVGPAVALGLDPDDLLVAARVNGVTRQSARARDMVVSPDALLAFVSQVMTLEPGDLVSTGTPAGVGPLEPGDWVEIEVEGVGILANPVVAAE